jgi:hypothetical protein
MAGPNFPDVPDAAGVPPVQRGPDNPGTNGDAPLTQDSATVLGNSGKHWGIYTSDGALALKPDNITALNFRAEYRIADFPIEQGGFESYDKVSMPFDTMVRVTKGGSLADRQEFVRAVKALKADMTLYSVICPEVIFSSVNVASVVIDRSLENGAGFIIADLQLREVRQNVETSFSSTQDPSGVKDVNGGAVQTTTPPANPGGVQ